MAKPECVKCRAALTNRTTLIDARRSEAMTNAALEMERSYRQYCVLDDRTLERVYQNQRKRYSEMLDAHAGVLPDDKLYQALRQDLNDLAQLQCKNSGPDAAAAARLEAFANANTEMVQSTRTVIFSRGQQLQQEIAERGQFFGWQALVLFLVSLGLVLLFTRMIIGPVKGIQRMINRPGRANLSGIRLFLKARASCARSVSASSGFLNAWRGWNRSVISSYAISHTNSKHRWPVCVKVRSCWQTKWRGRYPLSKKRSWRFWMPVAAIYKNLLNNCWTITVSWRMVLWCSKALRLNRWWTW